MIIFIPAGNNCEICVFGYYRQAGVDPSDSDPCTQCGCDTAGSTSEDCVKVWYCRNGMLGRVRGQSIEGDSTCNMM